MEKAWSVFQFPSWGPGSDRLSRHHPCLVLRDVGADSLDSPSGFGRFGVCFWASFLCRNVPAGPYFRTTNQPRSLTVDFMLAALGVRPARSSCVEPQPSNPPTLPSKASEPIAVSLRDILPRLTLASCRRFCPVGVSRDNRGSTAGKGLTVMTLTTNALNSKHLKATPRFSISSEEFKRN